MIELQLFVQLRLRCSAATPVSQSLSVVNAWLSVNAVSAQATACASAVLATADPYCQSQNARSTDLQKEPTVGRDRLLTVGQRPPFCSTRRLQLRGRRRTTARERPELDSPAHRAIARPCPASSALSAIPRTSVATCGSWSSRSVPERGESVQRQIQKVRPPQYRRLPGAATPRGRFRQRPHPRGEDPFARLRGAPRDRAATPPYHRASFHCITSR